MRKIPLFKTLSDEALREEYLAWRHLMYNNAQIAQSGIASLPRTATQMATIMRCVELIESICKSRGISPVRDGY